MLIPRFILCLSETSEEMFDHIVAQYEDQHAFILLKKRYPEIAHVNIPRVNNRSAHMIGFDFGKISLRSMRDAIQFLQLVHNFLSSPAVSDQLDNRAFWSCVQAQRFHTLSNAQEFLFIDSSWDLICNKYNLEQFDLPFAHGFSWDFWGTSVTFFQDIRTYVIRDNEKYALRYLWSEDPYSKDSILFILDLFLRSFAISLFQLQHIKTDVTDPNMLWEIALE